MTIRIKLEGPISRISVLLGAAILVVLLAKVVIDQFVIFGSTDERKAVDVGLLQSANDYRPHSPRILPRLADLESKGDETDLLDAERNIGEAIRLSPYNYNYRVILADIKDAQGDDAAAESALNAALALAPNDHLTHWRMGNLLVREGKVDAAIEHFRFVAKYNPAVVPGMFDLVWQASQQNESALRQIAGDPKAQLLLARSFANKSRGTSSVEIAESVDRNIALNSPDTPVVIDTLVSKGFPGLARDLWLRIVDPDVRPDRSDMWNGSFEGEASLGLKQFDWNIAKSEYARTSFDSRAGHTGSRSLVIDFLNRDTTRLDKDFTQLVVLRPRTNYQLSFFVKTQDLRLPRGEGPQIVILPAAKDTSAVIGQSDPISAENSDWQPMSFNFLTPANVTERVPLLISIRLQPRYSYEDPSTGRIWLDDFALREAGRK